MSRFGGIVRHEWRLTRSTALLGLALWAACVVVAVSVGHARASRAAESARLFMKVEEDQIAHYRQRAEAIERVRAGGDAAPVRLHPRELDWGPTQPLYVAAWVPMKVVLPPAPLAALAVGDSEIRPPAYRVSLWNGELVPVVEPSANPLAVTVGRFDLVLVTVWLLPLLVIALSFDLSAAERDAGILPLVLSQPVSPRTLLAAKLLVRSGVLLAAVAFAVGLSAPVVDWQPGVGQRLAAWLAVSLAYGATWLALATAVDSLGRPASWNALALAGAWLFSTSVAPAVVQAGVASLHPVAARAAWAEDRRAFETSRERALDAAAPDEKARAVDAFRRSNPRYGDALPAQDTIGYYYLTRAAQVAASEPERLRLDQATSDPLRRQERLVGALRYISPSALAFSALLVSAGAGRGRYEHLLAEGAKYDARYKEFLWPRMFGNSTLAASEFDEIPRFSPAEERSDAAVARVKPPLLGLVALAAGALIFAVVHTSVRAKAAG